MTLHKVGYLIGSPAKGSINRKLAKALVRLAPPELVLSEISFTDLPLYSYDYDADYRRQSVQGGHCGRRRRAVRHPGIQSFDTRWVEECD